MGKLFFWFVYICICNFEFKIIKFLNKFFYLFLVMLDFIRFVYGNLVGIKKLVKEFRFYWKYKILGKYLEIDQDFEEKMEIDE